MITIKRNTIQRTIVFDTVNSLKSHATADEVYIEISKTHPTISRGTVFRNLNQLAENGDVKKLEILNGPDRYDHRSFNHYHMQCSSCGKLFDVEMDYIHDLAKTIKNANGFEIESHDIVFKGICQKCKE